MNIDYIEISPDTSDTAYKLYKAGVISQITAIKLMERVNWRIEERLSKEVA